MRNCRILNIKLRQQVLLDLFFLSDMPLGSELVYYPPTHDCPEEGSFEINLRYLFIDEQMVIHEIREGQAWWQNEAIDMAYLGNS